MCRRLSGLYAWLGFMLHVVTRLLSPRQKLSITPIDIDDPPIPHQNTQEDTQAHQASYTLSEGREGPPSPETSAISSTSQRTLRDETMSQRTNIDMSAATLEDMVANILNAMECFTESDLKFVPETLLRQIINQPAVEKVLQHSSNLILTSSIQELATFFSIKAFKVFAILATNRRLDLIEHFYQNDFQNDMLPVKKRWLDGHERSTNWVMESCNKGKGDYYDEKISEAFRCGGSSPWRSWEIDNFWELWQWPFVPPVFTKDQFRYEFENKIHLPFTKSGEKKKSASFYSYVEEKSIHIDHLPKNIETAVDDQGNPRVAIKELKRSGGDFENVAEGEASVLEIMREFQNEHLIKAIAYYRKGGEHYFMFPWAEMGNLWQFWKHNTPKTEGCYIIWVLTQLTGLAHAIEVLHHEVHHQSEANCRHGDLKPANILCFKTKGGQQDNPRPVITDVGLAKVHNKATEWRSLTGSTAATLRYAAPELGVDAKAPRSRRFDVWSLGCIFLEFIIWLLYGAEMLQIFSEDLDAAFYELQNLETDPKTLAVNSKTRKSARVHPLVETWISYIKNDWRCSHGSAIQRLVELLDTRLLKVQLNISIPTNDQDKHIPPTREATSVSKTPVPMIIETLTEEPVSTSQSPVPIITETLVAESVLDSQTPAPINGKPGGWANKRKSTTDLPRDSSCRAYAPEMRETLKAILDDLESGKITAIGHKPSEETLTPPGLSRARFIEKDGRLAVPITWVR